MVEGPHEPKRVGTPKLIEREDSRNARRVCSLKGKFFVMQTTFGKILTRIELVFKSKKNIHCFLEVKLFHVNLRTSYLWLLVLKVLTIYSQLWGIDIDYIRAF